MHIFSDHPDQVKKCVVSGLFLRALRISRPPYLEQEINVINYQLKK